MMAMMSSAMVSVERNERSPAGMRLPNSARMPRQNAISFAMGTPQPCSNPLPTFTAVYTSAGTMAPPAAPRMGSSALRGFFSSPAVISNLISRPTSRKKMAMRKSLMKCSSERCGAKSPSEMPMSNVRQNSAKYGSTGVFSMTSAATAAASMSMVARVDEWVNSSSLRLRRWWRRTSGSRMRSVGAQVGSPLRQAGGASSCGVRSGRAGSRQPSRCDARSSCAGA